MPYTNFATRLPDHAAQFDAMLAELAANIAAQRPTIAIGDEVTVLIGRLTDAHRAKATLIGIGPKNIRVSIRGGAYTFTRAHGTSPGEDSMSWRRLDGNDLARINRDLPARKAK